MFDLLRELLVLLAVRTAAIEAGGVVAVGLAAGLALGPGMALIVAAVCVIGADALGQRLSDAVEREPFDRTIALPRAQLVRPVEATARLGLPAIRTAVAA